MIQPGIYITITDPDGNELDVTDRIDSDGLNSISEQVAEDLVELIHSDMDLELRDDDGAIEAFFANAEPEDTYEISVVRDTLKRRPKWEKVFGGVLELPWSLRFNRKENTVSLQAFSFSKLLERTSAETVKRTIQAMTGSATAAAATVTNISPNTDDLLPGDTISLDNDEERVIATVDSSSQVTVTENWTTSYTTKTLTVLTPYYRNKGVDFLAGELFDAASINQRDIEVTQELSTTPVLQDMNDDGVTTGDPRSLVEDSGNIQLTWSAGNRKVASSPVSGFTDGAADNDCQGDWRPYGDTEPSSIVEVSNTSDDGTVAWDHVNGDWYTLNINVEVGVPSPALDTTTLELRKNGVYDSDLESWTAATGTNGYESTAHEWDGTQIVWSAVRDDGSSTVVGSFLSGGVKVFGQPRRVEQLSATAWYHGDDTITFNVAGVSVSAPADFRIWTLRCVGTIVVGMYWAAGMWYVRLWDKVTLDFIDDYEVIASSVSSNPAADKTFMTVFTDGEEDIAVGYVNDYYFILARGFRGVIPYAEFEGLSVSGALKELALLTVSVFEVDRFKFGSFRPRGTALTDTSPAELGPIIERESVPIWEFYRTSVRVEGETEAGGEIDVLVGDTGDSARRLELSSQLVTTRSLAEAVAAMYWAFLSQKRNQESLTTIEQGTVLRAFDRVTLDGKTWMVLDPDFDLFSREQSMQLVTI